MTDTRRVRKSEKNHRRRNLIVLSVLGVLVVAVAGVGIYTYVQLSSARDDIDTATTSASELQAALEAGDQPSAQQSLTTLQQSIGDANSTVGNPVFSLFSHLPVVGKNIDAVRTVTSSLERVADSGVPPLVQIADQLNSKTFNPRDGAINVDAIARIGPNVAKSSKVIGAASTRVNSIDASSLMGSLQRPVRDVQDKLGHAATVAQRATTASDVVPQMLSGKHSYLLVFQNNAEIRATGGLPGAYAVLQVDDGKVSLGQQGSGASMGSLPYKATPISEEESNLFDTKLVSDFRDINFTPDFPRAAEIGVAILEREKGIDVDGVLSVDPVTLSYVLAGLGPITLKDGSTLTADNAVDVLLNGVYVNYSEPDAQDAFFAAATQQIFDKVLTGQGDPTVLLKALARATDEHRVQVWTKDSNITGLLGDAPIAGKLPVGKAARSTLGIYLNDATGAKMQYYLDYNIDAKATKCAETGAQTYQTITTLKSNAPADSADLPVSIRGPGFGAPPGAMFVNTYVYAPDGGKVTKLTIDGKKTFSFPGTQDGRGVEFVTVQVDPGKTVTVEATVMSGAGQRGSTRIMSTPSIKPGTNDTTIKSAC